MSYIIKELEDVFHPEFVQYMIDNADMSKKSLQQIMNRITEYERKNNLEFVSMPGNDLIIFREL